MTDEKKKGRFVAAGGRNINPRDGKPVDTVVSLTPAYLPLLMNAQQAGALYHLEPWFAASLDAIATGVSTAEVFPQFLGAEPDDQADPKIMALIKTFLERTDQTGQTVGERMFALDLDRSLFGYWAMEIVRGADRKPAGWYHVPGATVRVKADGSRYAQVDPATGSILKTFAPYAPGGNKEGLPELVVARQYDPTALYAGTPAGAALVGSIDRLSLQDQYNRKLLGKGGMTPMILLIKEALDEESYKRLVGWFEGLHGGDEKDQVGILDGIGEGADLKFLVQEGEDVAFKAGEEMLRERILARTHVPPTKVSLAASNYATAYQEDQTFKFEVTQPRLRMILSRLSMVARELAPEGYSFGFKQSSLEDFSQLVGALKLLLESGAITVNQVLARTGWPPIGPDGDAHIAFTNQGPVSLEDLVAGNLPATPGKMVDNLIRLRQAIEAAKEPHVHEVP
jgi:hypothetical protein